MKGVYCLLILLDRDATIRVGALGRVRFPEGVYAYVGSAMSGIEGRVERHLRKVKRRRWHIDHLLSVARVVTVVSIPAQSREAECAVAAGLLGSPGTEVVVEGFGSSDCRCPSHLIRFSGVEHERLLEEAATRISLLCCPYPETVSPLR
jgi:Uri superfamily endonuclease